MTSPIQFPVQAVEWSCHAATTIKDASGAVVAEVSNHGRSARADEAIATEIVRRLNAHDDMLEALREIALAGMSGTGMESEDGMRDWHARQAWKFIGIAARALPDGKPLRSAA